MARARPPVTRPGGRLGLCPAPLPDSSWRECLERNDIAVRPSRAGRAGRGLGARPKSETLAAAG